MDQNKMKRPELHRDHRQRLKRRFENEGLMNFEDHNVLELLLFYSIPRCDTNETAHLLLNEFGSLSNVFNAPVEELTRVPGLGKESALFLKLIPEVCSKYLQDINSEKEMIRCGADAAKQLAYLFVGLNHERFVCVITDNSGRIVKKRIVDDGGMNTVGANLENVVFDASCCRQKNIIIAHNHPNGFAVPSAEDIKTTEEFAKRLKNFDMQLCEHVIFAKNESYLLSECPKLERGLLLFGGVDY